MFSVSIPAQSFPLREVAEHDDPALLARVALDLLPGQTLPIFGIIDLTALIDAIARSHPIAYLAAATWGFTPEIVFTLSRLITAKRILAGELWIGTNRDAKNAEGYEAARAILTAALKIRLSQNHAKLLYLDFADGTPPLSVAGTMNIVHYRTLGPNIAHIFAGQPARDAIARAFATFTAIEAADVTQDQLTLDL